MLTFKIYKSGCVLIDDSGAWYLNFSIDKNSVEFISKVPLVEKKSLQNLNLLTLIDLTDILYKKVTANNVQDSLEEAFPAIRKDDIYFDYQSQESSVISIIGKKKITHLTSEHNKVFSASNSIRLLPTVKNNFNEVVSNERLYEIAMAYFIKEVEFSHNFQQILENAKNHTFNARFFELTKWSAIAVFLIGLLINFFYHEQYRSELEEARILTQTNKNLNSKIEALQKQVDSDNILLAGNNTNDINSVRIFNNLIVEYQDIKFFELSFSPIKNKLSKDQDLRIEEGKVFISGSTRSEKNLNTFIESTRKLKMVNDISILSIDDNGVDIEFDLDIRINEIE